MKLLARILSHGFAIAVVLLLAIGLIYRGELFPEYDLPAFLDIGKLADHQNESTTGRVDRDEVEAQAEAPATADDLDQTAVQRTEIEGTAEPDAGGGSAEDIAVVDVTEPEPGPPEVEVTVQEPAGVDSPQPSPAIETEAPSIAAQEVAEDMEEVPALEEEKPAAETVVPLSGETGQPTGGEPSAADLSSEGESEAATAADLPVSEVMPADVSESTESAAPSPESVDVIPEDAGAAMQVSRPQEKAYQLLADAREAYWLRDYDTAESKYLALTRLEPDNPDGYGELGNMYFSQGKWDQAATAYYAAGVRLVGQGLLEQAGELIAVIRGLNGADADDLEQKIADARSAANQ
jgi:hypothetical protein